MVDSGDVTFNLGGKTAKFTDDGFEGILVAQSAGSTATLTVSGGTLSGMAGEIGDGGNGTLNVTAGGHLVFHDPQFPTPKLFVGDTSNGVLNISGGGQANLDNLTVAAGDSTGLVPSTGQVTVTDPTSTLTVNLTLDLGDHPNGTATMLVKNSATVTGNQLYIGFDQGSTATVTVDAAIANAHNWEVGSGGTGNLIIQDGGQVSAVTNFLGAGVVSIGQYNGSNGTLTITGAGSSLSSSGDLNLAVTSPLNAGDHSTAEFKVIGGGSTIQITGNLNTGVDQPTLAFTIDPTGISPIQIGQMANLAGNLDVELSDYTPSLGQSFNLLNAGGGITGQLRYRVRTRPSFRSSNRPTAWMLSISAP